MWNTEPRPGVLSTVSSPPIRSVSILAMVRPRPAPAAPCAAAEARVKGSNTRSISCCDMPGPVSWMSMCAISRA